MLGPGHAGSGDCQSGVMGGRERIPPTAPFPSPSHGWTSHSRVPQPPAVMQTALQINRARLPVAACCIAILLSVSSCAEREGVRSYTAEDLSVPRAAPLNDPPPAAEPGVAWFFKMQGSPESVDGNKDAFGEVVGSLQFDEEGTPSWDVPEGWTQSEGNQFRYATLTRDGSDPPLELTISRLAAPDPTADEYLKLNIDRWRGQVGLEPYPQENWRQNAIEAGEFREPDQTNGDFYLVILEGTGGDGQPEKMLAAIVPRPAGGDGDDASQSGADRVPEGAEPVYSTPEEWQTAPLRTFQLAHWSSGEDTDQADISVSSAGGGLQANIARWRRQIGLNPDGRDAQAVSEVTVDEYPALRVELTGAEESIIAIIVPGRTEQWFFKLQGTTAAVEAERERFDAFVESIHFE